MALLHPLALQAYHSYREKFPGEPSLFRSPGRINIIGEHTDYNDGFVLPAAIDKAVYIAAGRRADSRISLYAMSYNASFETDAGEIRKTPGHWSNYLVGVAALLLEQGHALGGFNMVVASDVPVGAGLSSSAALECAAVFALNDLFGLGLDRNRMIRVAQKAEHVFAGVQCGIMDQFASMFGRKDQVIRLDCRTMEYRYLPFDAGPYELVLFNSNVSHSLASSAYNDRREECARAVSMVREKYPAVDSLRDCTMEYLLECVKPADKISFTRARYVVEEIERLQQACAALEKGDIAAVGRKMYETHEGLSRLYEVSCPETDFLVSFVRRYPAVAGARMMGGGFGGCTLNLVEKGHTEELVSELSVAYASAMGLELSVIEVRIDDGTEGMVISGAL